MYTYICLFQCSKVRKQHTTRFEEPLHRFSTVMAAYQGQGYRTPHRPQKKMMVALVRHSSKDGRVPTSLETDDGSIEMIHSIIFEVKKLG